MPKKLPVWLRPHEADALLAAATSERDRMIMRIGLLAGLRVSEICKLRVEHVDLPSRQLLVYQGKGSKDRMVPIARRLMEPLEAWIGERTSGYVFESPRFPGRHLSPRTVQIMIVDATKRAGLLKRITPHKLRHTFCTEAYRKSHDILAVQQMAGHSNVSTTQIYAHVDTEDLLKVADLL